MQLHHLTLSAIGPFATEYHIDCGALGATGLFLLEGPTGSGKSTIIDAIVYALYGKVASNDASEDRMRSDHARDDQESLVDLVFETTHGIFRVVRQAERMRPKKRGTGLVKQQAAITLYRLSVAELDAITNAYGTGASHNDINALDVGTVRSTRLDEAGAEITHAIGLDRAQFSQTIVLPQGEFAQFLRADPEKRRLLLQKVFGTEIYNRAQDELAAMKREAAKTIEAAHSARRDAIRAFAQAVPQFEHDPEELVASDDSVLLETVTEYVAQLSQEESSAQSAEAVAAQAEQEAHTQFNHGKQLTELHAERAQLRVQKEGLAAEKSVIDRATAIYEAAMRASYVTPSIEALDRARTDQEQALKAFVSSVEHAQKYAELGPIHGDVTEATSSTLHIFARTFRENRGSLVTQRDQAQQVLGQLEHIATLEAGLPGRRQALETERTRVTQLRDQAAQIHQELAERPAQRAQLTAERDQHALTAAQLATHTSTLEAARALLAVHVHVETAHSAHERNKQAVEQAASAVKDAADREHELRTSWLSQLAGIVAQELQPGAPCAVCGALEHPQPAALDPEAATEQDVEDAERARKAAEQTLSQAQAALAASQERLDLLRAQTGDTTRHDAEQQREQALAAQRISQEAAQTVEQLNRAIVDHDAHTKTLTDKDKNLGEQIVAAAIRIEEQTRALTSDTERVTETLEQYAAELAEDAVPAGVDTVPGGMDAESGNAGSDARGGATIAALSDFLERRASTLAELLRALDALNTAEQACNERTREADASLREHGFATSADVRDAALPPTERAQLRTQIDTYTQRVATNRTQLDAERFHDVPEELNIDLEQLKANHVEAQLHAKAASHRANTANSVLAGARTRSEHIEAALAGQREQRERVAPIIRMADIASGNSSENEKRMTLATYVLLRRFEDVVAAANTRLTALSDGRYELVRSDTKEDVSSRKTGLALKVIDHDTEKARDPRTLSGGETFNASLSLALGLADIVTAEAGGVELGTLFIDEGFGTLDPESLEKVITILGSLRDGGRTVGVVSHVEALKQSISDGISVRRLPSGASTLEVRA